MTPDALVIGGTGPTGPYIVRGLLRRGYRVAILHTGRREVDEIPSEVEHIHTDPYDEESLRQALAGRRFALCIATYGRLRMIARVMQGRCERFISVGGQPCYLGYMNPQAPSTTGMVIPTGEEAEKVSDPAQDEKGFRILLTEQQLFEAQPRASHFRYPVIYGPRQALPREWSIVKRVLDGRRQVILPDGGLTLLSLGYAENMAHALLLAVDKPEAASGEIFNCADSQTLTLRQWVDCIAGALDHDWRVVAMTGPLARAANPLLMQPATTHRMMDIYKLRHLLGYEDPVPVQEALARTARALAANPPALDSADSLVLEDPFDYAAEDRAIEAWDAAMSQLPDPGFVQEPGYTMAYSGPGGRTRSNPEFE